MACLFERPADRADAAIHHVGRGDDVGARRRLVERLADQHLHRRVVRHISALVEQAVLPVAGVGIERNVGEHANAIAAGVAHRLDRAAHKIVRGERLAPVVAALFGRRVGEQREARDAQRHRLFRARGDPVDRPARHAGQRADRLLDPVPVGHEQRPDEIGGGQHGFAVERAAPAGRAGAAQAQGGIGSGHRARCAGNRRAAQFARASAHLLRVVGAVDLALGRLGFRARRHDAAQRRAGLDRQQARELRPEIRQVPAG